MESDIKHARSFQRKGYAALDYHLHISTVDWVYFLDYVRCNARNLTVGSTLDILLLLTKSLPIPSPSPKDEVHNPLRRLQDVLELDIGILEGYIAERKERRESKERRGVEGAEKGKEGEGADKGEGAKKAKGKASKCAVAEC